MVIGNLVTPASFTGVWGKIGLCFWAWNPSDITDHSLTLILNARLQVQDCCKGPRIGCKDRPLLSKQVSDSKVAVGHHMCATCVLLITSDLPVCVLEVWGVSEVQNMALLTCIARQSHGSAEQCKSTDPSKTGCMAFCFGSAHALNMQACATSTEWLRAISQAFLSCACMPRHVTVGGFEPNQWSSHCQSCMHDLLLCTIGIHARRNRSDERDACLAMRAANVRMHHTWLSCWSPSQKFI